MSHLTYYILQAKGMGFIHTGKKKKKRQLGFIQHGARTKWKGEMNDCNEEFCELSM